MGRSILRVLGTVVAALVGAFLACVLLAVAATLLEINPHGGGVTMFLLLAVIICPIAGASAARWFWKRTRRHPIQ